MSALRLVENLNPFHSPVDNPPNGSPMVPSHTLLPFPSLPPQQHQTRSEGTLESKPYRTALSADVEEKMRRMGWSSNQRRRALENPSLAARWIEAAAKNDYLYSPGGWAWNGFCSGDEPPYRRPEGCTGYRFVRGTHSGTYIRDPEGRDHLPVGYSMPETTTTAKRSY